MARLAHVSDLHATPVQVRRLGDFAGKRFFGWLSWRLRRHRRHRPEVLEALVADLASEPADQIAVTGDLTNVASDEEFPEALGWLERLGGPQRVTAIPGNHDAYVAVPRERSWNLWADYLQADGASLPLRFPALRVRGGLALIGLCSANPTAPLMAAGTLGSPQLEALEKLLGELDPSLCRVVLVHHSPVEGTHSSRRALTDRAELRAVLARAGADLVLHGHGHRTHFDEISGPSAAIPVVGTRSASDVGSHPDKRAQYHLYDIEPAGSADRRFRISVRVRGYDPATGRFGPEAEREL